MLKNRKYYTPHELMIASGLVNGNGKPNVSLYNQWLYRNIFKACVEATGPGTTSEYSFANVLQVAIIIKLRGFKIPLKIASKLSELIIESNVEDAYIIIDGTELIVKIRVEKEVDYLVLKINKIIEEVELKLPFIDD